MFARDWGVTRVVFYSDSGQGARESIEMPIYGASEDINYDPTT